VIVTVFGRFLGDMPVFGGRGVLAFSGKFVGVMSFAGTVANETGEGRGESGFSKEGAHPRETRVHVGSVQEQSVDRRPIFRPMTGRSKKVQKK
jgi:hypothetical protein